MPRQRKQNNEERGGKALVSDTTILEQVFWGNSEKRSWSRTSSPEFTFWAYANLTYGCRFRSLSRKSCSMCHLPFPNDRAAWSVPGGALRSEPPLPPPPPAAVAAPRRCFFGTSSSTRSARTVQVLSGTVSFASAGMIDPAEEQRREAGKITVSEPPLRRRPPSLRPRAQSPVRRIQQRAYVPTNPM